MAHPDAPGRIEKIAKIHPKPFIEIHPRDAAKLGIENNQSVQVRSRRGKAQFPAKVTKAIAPGTVFVPMHGVHCGLIMPKLTPSPIQNLAQIRCNQN